MNEVRSRMNGPPATERPDARMPDMPRKAQPTGPLSANAEEALHERSTEVAEDEAVERDGVTHCSLTALLFVARYLAHGSGPKS